MEANAGPTIRTERGSTDAAEMPFQDQTQETVA
jgi:hypothetical protein